MDRKWLIWFNVLLLVAGVAVLWKRGGLKLGLDLRGGVHLVYAVDETKLPAGITVEDALERTIEVIRNRIDPQGVGEVLIHREGEKWIVVQFPGSQDTEHAKNLIGTTALLEFKLVDEPPQGMDLKAVKEDPTKLPPDAEVLTGKAGRLYLLKKETLLTGASLVKAHMRPSGAGELGVEPFVELEFNSEGAKRFGEITTANVQKQLAIVLDGVVHSAPVVRNPITDGKAIIEGGFGIQEARDLALVLRAGSLPVPIHLLNENVVGPSLGQDSVAKGSKATIIGGVLVMLFMAMYYRVSGVIANVGVLANVLFLMAGLSLMDATLTLPGIAGIALTMGMSVDSNVLIFERIREELQAGRTIRIAVDAGYKHAWVTIFDSHVTTLITAAVLFMFGTGPVKGFAVSLSLGVTISLYTAYAMTKVIFDMRVNRPGVTALSI